MKKAEIVFTSGPAEGRRFVVSESGCRIGRGSDNEASVPDEGLSRRHCFIEWREKSGFMIADFGSSNGTYLNGEDIGTESRPIAFGDTVEIGESAFVFTDPAGESARPVDLGLAPKPAGPAGTADAGCSVAPKRGSFFHVLMVVAAVLAAGSLALVILPRQVEETVRPVGTPKRAALRVTSLYYEKVEATPARICRLEAVMKPDGELRLVLDDVPDENRHADKTATLKDESRERLDEILTARALLALEPSYAGPSVADQNELTGYRLRATVDGRVFECSVENDTEPAPFKAAREALEALVVNELGMWALQYTRDQLIAKSAENEEIADAKWEERDVDYGNLAAAIRSYREAIVVLDTVNPKPSGFTALQEKLRMAEDELDRRYRDQSFRADQAIKLGDFKTAAQELRLLLELLVDKTDDRYVKASAKLVDAESRLKKGGKRK